MSEGFCCTICSERYAASDEIYSTSCGHVFHLHCLQDWERRSRTCPTCRVAQYTKYKLFLNFDDPPPPQENSQRVMDLTLKVEELENELTSLQDREIMENSRWETLLEASEKKCVELTEQIEYFNQQNDKMEQEIILQGIEKQNLQTERDALKTKLSLEFQLLNTKIDQVSVQLKQRETEISKLQSDLNTSHMTKLSLEKANKDLDMKVTCFAKQIAQQEFEKRELQSALNELSTDAKTGGSNREMEIILKERNNMLEERNKQISLELQKVVQSYAELSLNSTRMQTILLQQCATSPSAADTGGVALAAALPSNNPIDCNKENRAKDVENYTIQMKGLSEQQIKMPLKQFVGQLAKNMGINLAASQMDNVYIMEWMQPTKQYISPQQLSLIVKFKPNTSLKKDFLTKCHLLQNFADCADITIAEHQSKADTMLQYAQKLKTVGYSTIYKKNGMIYVKQLPNSKDFIRIVNCDHVDRLMKNYETKKFVG